MKQISGFVALLDVLGFRSLVSGSSSAVDLKRYVDAVEGGIAGKAATPDVKFVLFSDSIIVTTKDDTELSLRVLLRACSRLLGLLLENEIAVRGAISHGEFFREATDSGVFVAGRPIVDAYDFEQKQDWIGIMVTPSVLRAKSELPDLCRMPPRNQMASAFEARLPWILLLQRYPCIPFRDNSQFDGFTVVPTPQGQEIVGVSRYLETCISAIDKLKRLAPDPKAQHKYVETDRWLQFVRSEWDKVKNNPGFPTSVEYY